MSTFQILLVCLSGLFIVALVSNGFTERTRSREAHALMLSEQTTVPVHVPLVESGRVALYIPDGQSVRGEAVPGPEGYVTLVAATLHTPGRSAVELGGRVELREDTVNLIQRLDGSGVPDGMPDEVIARD